MLKRFCLIVILLVCHFPHAAYPNDLITVTVLPFQVHAQENLSYLQTEIPRLIMKYLKIEGAAVTEPDKDDISSWDQSEKDVKDARRIGLKQGVDYVIWGSLSRVGAKFSLDAKLIQSFTEELPITFFTTGEGIENLLTGVQKISQNIGSRLFERQKINDIIVTGNNRIEADAIMRHIKTKPGETYIPKNLSDDLKAIYAMGYFEDIRVEYEDTPQGRLIEFIVQEKPTIRQIKYKGNHVYDDEEIAEVLTIKSGSILNIFSIQSNILRIEDLYKEKNYHNVKVQYEVEELENNQGDLEFIIKEGKKLKITKISFEGNDVYSDKKLKKIIKTNEKGFFSFFTSSGELDQEELNQDTTKLNNFYHNHGFIEAKVGEPIVEYKEDMIYVTFKIEEGPKFKVGRVDISGDFIKPEAELIEELKIREEEFYNREVIRSDILFLTDLYSDEGFAYVDIYPRVEKNLDSLSIDIEYVIKKGRKVHFESIIITGNNRTRDKVIRRELRVYEQELYSGKALKKGIRNLYRLDFFKDIKVDTVEGSADDKIILTLDVKEKPTGQFMFGGGYSSIDLGYVTAAIAQNNLFGRGQKLQLKGTVAAESTTYTLSFTEPYLFDTSISAGFDIYDQKRELDDYDKHSQGARARLGLSVYEDTRLYLSYNYDVTDIDITASRVWNEEEQEYEYEGVSESIVNMEGENTTKSTKATLRYDSRDRILNPTEGSLDSISIEYAGFGGDIAFTKYIARSGWYFPFLFGTVGLIHGKAGLVHENPDGFLPDFKKFYLGGINSVRGFRWRDIHAEDEEGEKIGGTRFVQTNLEWIIPLAKDAGLVGVLFVDAGNVFGENEEVELKDTREGGGLGIRWYSPVGPIRLEYGWILDPVEGESTEGRWEFTVGSVL